MMKICAQIVHKCVQSERIYVFEQKNKPLTFSKLMACNLFCGAYETRTHHLDTASVAL